MNLDLFKDLLCKASAEQGWDWEERQTEDSGIAILTCEGGLRAYDDGIFLLVRAFQSNAVLIEFVFDRIDPTYDCLKLVNDFNSNVVGLRASIDKRGQNLCLVLDASNICCADEQNAVNAVMTAIASLTNETTEKYLHPLTVITR